MERTANVKVRWKKLGGGSFHMTDSNGKQRIIKPGQTFSAYPHEIPQAFRDVVVALESLPEHKPPPPIKAVDSVYKLKSRGSGGWYDVVNPNGKVLNEKALKKEDADKLIEDLTK